MREQTGSWAKRLREPASGLTHLAGALSAVVGLVVLVTAAVRRGTPWHVVSFAVFGASLILLYTASSLYHLLPLPPRGVQALRRLDHMMIYVLIAGTYTPFCLVALRGPWGWSLLGVVWTLAVAGIVLKGLWLGAPRWLSTGFYLAMGWMVVVAVFPLSRSVAIAALAWLAVGGLFYTVGAVFYATRWPRLVPGKFGFHELWHLFVIAGSLSHFVAVYRLLPPA